MKKPSTIYPVIVSIMLLALGGAASGALVLQFSATASGTLGGVGFSSESIVIYGDVNSQTTVSRASSSLSEIIVLSGASVQIGALPLAILDQPITFRNSHPLGALPSGFGFQLELTPIVPLLPPAPGTARIDIGVDEGFSSPFSSIPSDSGLYDFSEPVEPVSLSNVLFISNGAATSQGDLELSTISNVAFSAIPEPSVSLLFFCGLLGVGSVRRRPKKNLLSNKTEMPIASQRL